MKRQFRVSAIALLLSLTVSCGGVVTALRSALAAAPALTTGLVSSGIITQAQADGAVKDFTDGGNVALALKDDLDAARNKPNANVLKAQAAHQAKNDWKAIYDRGHFGSAPAITKAANLADGIFLFIEAYYADKNGETPHAGSPAVDGLSDSEFQDILEQKVKELDRAMKAK